MDGQPIVVALRTEDLSEALRQCAQISARIGAAVASEKLEKEFAGRDKQRKDRRLHNTRLLLSHYADFQSHREEAVYKASQMESKDLIESLMMMKDDEVIVDSIRASAIRTCIILEHIDKTMRLFELWANERGEREKRQYDIIQRYYINPDKCTMQELADAHGVGKSTIHGDIRDAEEKLAVLFFGMDGLNFYQ